MYLSNVSPEVLSEIASFLSGGQIISLWLCGDVHLTTLMGASGGITRVHLYDSSSLTTSRFPLMLCELRGLVRLRLHLPRSFLGPTLYVRKRLSQLSHLLSLDLFTLGNAELLFDASGEGSIWDLSSAFPVLNSLGLSLPHSLPNKPPLLSLPSTLESFSLATAAKHSNGTWQCAWGPLPFRLPTGLLDLDFHPDAPSGFLLPKFPDALPSSLTSLAVPMQRITKEWLYTVPKTLTRLSVCANDSEEDIDLGASIPPSLISLALIFESTPQNEINLAKHATLESFELSSTFSASYLTFYVSLNLPPSLKHLYIKCRASISELLLPQHLETLVVKDCLDLSPNTFKTLQTGIVSMQKEGDGGILQVEREEHAFPQTLKVLKVTQAEGELLTASHLLSSLPPSTSLHTLEFEAPMTLGDWKRIPSTVHTLKTQGNFDSFASFPPRLVELNLRLASNSRLDEKDLMHLPRTIRVFILEFNKVAGRVTETLLHHLPSNMLQFKLKCPHTICATLTKGGLQTLSQWEEIEALELSMMVDPTVRNSDFGLLPRTLRVLSIEFMTGDLTGEVFTYMPRFLKELVMPSLYQVTPEHLALLPRGLRRLYLPTSRPIPNISDKLPTTLEWMPLDGPLTPSLVPVIDPRTYVNSYTSHNQPSKSTTRTHYGSGLNR